MYLLYVNFRKEKMEYWVCKNKWMCGESCVVILNGRK